MTQAELQPDLMAFADRYATKIGDATILFETRIPSAEARLAALRKRFLDIHSAFTIAAGPNPGSALLDMVVLVTLSRMVWEEVGASGVFGGSVAPITAAYRGLEPDIWSIASDVLTPHQLSLLGHLIQR